MKIADKKGDVEDVGQNKEGKEKGVERLWSEKTAHREGVRMESRRKQRLPRNPASGTTFREGF